MLAYLLVKSPLKDRFCFAQQTLMESMLFVYNLCLLVLMIMDIADAQAESIRAFFGGIMVVILIVGPVATAVLIVLKLFLKSRDLYQQFRAEKEERKIFKSYLSFHKGTSSWQLCHSK